MAKLHARQCRAGVAWVSSLVLLALASAPIRAEMFYLTVHGSTNPGGATFQATIGIDSPVPSLEWTFPGPYPGTVESVQVEVNGVTTFSLHNTFGGAISLLGSPGNLMFATFSASGFTTPPGVTPPQFGTFLLTLENTASSTPVSLIGAGNVTPGPGSQFNWLAFNQPGQGEEATITDLTLVSAVPEPGTLALLALGAAGLAGRAAMRRRQRG